MQSNVQIPDNGIALAFGQVGEHFKRKVPIKKRVPAPFFKYKKNEKEITIIIALKPEII